MLYTVTVTFDSVDEILKCDHSNESYWAVISLVLFIMLYTVTVTFDSVDEILKCDHSNESYWAVISLVLFIMLYTVTVTFDSVDEILKCDHSNESYWAFLPCGAVHYAVPSQESMKVLAFHTLLAVQGDSHFWVCRRNLKVWPFKWKLLSGTLPWHRL